MIEFYEKTKEYSFSAFYFGVMFHDGIIVNKDHKKAKELYETAINLNNSAAMNNLGYMYQNGEGVEQDINKAKEWYEKGLSLGCISSIINLAMYLYGNHLQLR